VTARRRLNCWEYQGCERGPGGRKSANGEQCPASTAEALDGRNSGKNGGRACWVVPGTLCDGMVSGPFEEKYHECRKCAFHARVQIEEGLELEPNTELLAFVRSTS